MPYAGSLDRVVLEESLATERIDLQDSFVIPCGRRGFFEGWFAFTNPLASAERITIMLDGLPVAEGRPTSPRLDSLISLGIAESAMPVGYRIPFSAGSRIGEFEIGVIAEGPGRRESFAAGRKLVIAPLKYKVPLDDSRISFSSILESVRINGLEQQGVLDTLVMTAGDVLQIEGHLERRDRQRSAIYLAVGDTLIPAGPPAGPVQPPPIQPFVASIRAEWFPIGTYDVRMYAGSLSGQTYGVGETLFRIVVGEPLPDQKPPGRKFAEPLIANISRARIMSGQRSIHVDVADSVVNSCTAGDTLILEGIFLVPQHEPSRTTAALFDTAGRPYRIVTQVLTDSEPRSVAFSSRIVLNTLHVGELSLELRLASSSQLGSYVREKIFFISVDKSKRRANRHSVLNQVPPASTSASWKGPSLK